ncbi:MAG: DUF975 family protein [Candidatus Marinimicrobia bacterium]|jgi:uncharacterized membrane protein|nr:DUF975 family protein [Candidatus Neomarinimicrobiota bacterium]
MNYTSTKSNQALMAQALKSLTGKWGIAIGAWLVFFILTDFQVGWEWQGDDGGDYKIGLKIIGLLIGGPLALGYTTLILLISRNQKPDFAILFSGFKRFGISLAAYLLMAIFIILWFLLLIIPGIIACLRYSQTWYILSEDENIGPLEAITKSKEMMVGNKWKLFCLYFRFTGWFILCIVTLGFAGLYVGPYLSQSCANFYNDLINDNLIEKTDPDEKNQETNEDKLTESHEPEEEETGA